MSNNRNYNIFFHLHTVSGITITVGLFIIFFAGAFTLFKEEIGAWENSGKTQHAKTVSTSSKEDFNTMFGLLEKKVPHVYGREFYGRKDVNSGNYLFYVSGTADTTVKEEDGSKDFRFELHQGSKQLLSQEENFSLGELLYLLHFYYQLDRIGYYISGFVAFFFFFAIITGVIVHWKKTFSNFFVFRPRQKMKTIWTDAHTALGFIGLPFQFIYAMTGAMFGLGILVAVSNGLWVYNGDSEKMYDDIRTREAEMELGKKQALSIDYNALVKRAEDKWEHFEVLGFHVQHYGSDAMTIEFWGEEHISSSFLGEGKVVYDVNGKEIMAQQPGDVDYYDGVWASVRRLHYAQFGNIGSIGAYLLKTVYFVLAMITCFVIVTGVLIWLEARNKKSITEKKRRYNQRVALIYLSLCLSMLPVTAASFIVSKLIPASSAASRETILNYSFFLGWVSVSIVFFFLRSNYRINKISILSGGILALVIPVVNGVVSGTWFWTNYAHREYGVFAIDVIWLMIGLMCALVFMRLKRSGDLEIARK